MCPDGEQHMDFGNRNRGHGEANSIWPRADQWRQYTNVTQHRPHGCEPAEPWALLPLPESMWLLPSKASTFCFLQHEHLVEMGLPVGMSLGNETLSQTLESWKLMAD